MTMTRWGIAVMVVALAGACGSDEQSACEVAYNLMCDKACECADGDECIIGGDGFSLTHDNRSDCVVFWAGLGCDSDEAANVDFEACEADLEAAQCVPAGDSNGVEFPASCDDQTQ